MYYYSDQVASQAVRALTADEACAEARRRLTALDPSWATATCAAIAAHIASDPTIFNGTRCDVAFPDICVRRLLGVALTSSQQGIECSQCPSAQPPPLPTPGGIDPTILLVGIGAVAAIAIAMSMQARKKVVIARVQPGG